MRIHAEEEPDRPEDPDQPDEPGDGAATATRLVPTVSMPNREWEYSTQVLSVAQVSDGTTLVKVLKDAGTEGWELAEVIDAGEKRVLLMRRAKRGQRESRRVGFAPPTHS